jgi:hypothetical protein
MIWMKKKLVNNEKKTSQNFKKFNPLFISLKVAHSAQEAPKKNSA